MAELPMIKRAQRRTPAIIAALVLVALGVLAVWVGIEVLRTGQLPAWAGPLVDQFGANSWNAPAVIAVAAGVLVLGIILIAAMIIPGKPSGLLVTVPDANSDVPTRAVLDRRSLTKLAGAEASVVDGVDSVSARSRSRRVDLKVRSNADDQRALQSAVTRSVQERVDGIGLAKTPRVSTRVRG